MKSIKSTSHKTSNGDLDYAIPPGFINVIMGDKSLYKTYKNSQNMQNCFSTATSIKYLKINEI